MTNFVYDSVTLPADKLDSGGGSAVATNPTRRWSPNDANRVFQALADIRTVLRIDGAVGDGVTDNAAAIQAAINANPGRKLALPRGSYRVNTSLLITQPGTHLLGDFGNRATGNGTEIIYYGTGPCIQIGVDNGHAWNAGDFNGPQDHLIENLNISHGAPDSTLASSGDANPHYKAGAYGIWDWRGGGVVLRNVGLEKFEANFVCIESDFNHLDLTASLYSKYGVYIGPRSDQCTVIVRNSFFCDRVVTIDGARVVRIMGSSFVGSGTTTSSAVEIRRGSGQVWIPGAWFEHLQGYAGTDQQSFVSAGEVDGYGTGGSIQSAGGSPNTASVVGVSIENPFVYTTAAAVANHTKYLISAGKCNNLKLHNPVAPPGISLNNLDSLVGVQAAQTPTSADTQIEIYGVNSTPALAKQFVNLGAGTPAVQIWATGASGCNVITSGRFSIVSPGASAGADQLQISQEGQAGNVIFITPQLASGQTTRLRFTKAVQPGARAAAPTTGTWAQGDRVYNEDPIAGGFEGWICVTGGTPGTWKAFGAIAP